MHPIEELIESARRHIMSPEEREEQRRSFAYGNASLSNPQITRETINEAAQRLASKTAPP